MRHRISARGGRGRDQVAMENVLFAGGGSTPAWWANTVFYTPTDADFSDEGSVGATPTLLGTTPPSIITTGQKYGDGCASFAPNPAGSRVTYPYNAAYDSTGAFTAAGWIYMPTVGVSSVARHFNLGARETGFYNAFWYTSSAYHYDGYFLNGRRYGTLSTGVQLDQWFHWALTRDDSDVVRYFLNGELDLQFTKAGTLSAVTGGLQLGGSAFGGLGGRMDDTMFVDGVCVWDAPFTPPTGPHNLADSYS